MANPTLQKAIQDINKNQVRGRPITGIKGPIAPWYGAYKPPSREEMGFVPNEEWDYKTANRTGGPGMEGQSLPEGAKGWDKYGRAYYGATAQGWLKKHDASIEANWEAALAQESKWKQLTGGVSAILKGTGGIVLETVLMGPGKVLKRGMGLTGGLADIGEVPEGQEVLAGRAEKLDVPEPTKSGFDFPAPPRDKLPNLPGSDLAARIVTGTPLIGEPLANIESQSLQSYLNRLGVYSQNAVNALKPAITPEIVGYNLARIALDRDNYQDNLAEIEANWHASSILYSNVVNPATRAEFDRRVKGGEDPGLLAMELENPVVEFVGEMIFDPWNLWIGPGKKAADAAYLSNANKVFMPADEVADALKVFKHHDEAEALASLSKLSEASAASAAKTIGNRAADLGMSALTTNGKRSALVDTGGQVAQWISYNVNNPDDILELMQALERRAGGSADEVAEATAKIMAITKRAKASSGVLFSPASFDLGYTLRQVMKGDPQKFLDETMDLIKAGDKAAVAEHAYKVLDDAAEKIYPSVAKRLKDGEDIGYVAKAMHKMDKGIVGKFYKTANNFFANVYMGMTPGYAARNVLMDNALIWLDMGPTNPFSASRWHDIGTKWQGGAITRAAERGISSPLAAAGVTTKGKTKWYNWGIALAEKFEKNSAKSIVGKSIDKTMRKMLGKGLPTLEPIVKAGGMSDDVGRFLINTTMNNYGDTSVAVNALRSRDIEVWKHISQWLDDDTMRALDGMGLLPSMLDSLAMSGNVDDALRNAGAVFDEVEALARSAMDEMPVVSRSNAALPDVVAIDLATDGEKLKFSAVVEADNKSMLSSIDSMNASRKAARNAVHTLPQSQHQELKAILDKYPLDESAFGALNDFATKHGDTFKETTRRISASRKPVDLVQTWDELGIGAIRGEPAAIITDTSIPYAARKKAFLSEAHRAFIDRKTAYWKVVREEFYGQATGLYGELSTYMANTFGTPMNDSSVQIATRLFQEADIYEKAYAFEDGLHYLTKGQPIAIGGAGGETVYASLNDGIENPTHFLNALNAQDEAGEFLYRSKGMPKKIYKDTTEVTSEVAYDMLLNRRMSKTREQIAAQFPGGIADEAAEAVEEFVKIPPPQAEDGSPTLARALYDQKEATAGLRQKVLSGLDSARGERMVLAETDIAEDALKQWKEAADIQIQEARMLSQGVATETRDFILHDYRAKRNYNQVAGYVYPYHFWYEQTYKKMAQRMAGNPAIASNYLRYKDTLGKLHAGAPDWWKYTINSNELLGLDMENPIYFNLEASLNPMNGLTNVDFDDRYKRTNWFTGLLQDMGKFGPSTHTIYSLATALALYSQGEEDAANRWAGRIIPQTRTIKAVSALAFDKPVELDPWVALLGGGLDPYERNRVGRALGAMANEGKYTEAELLDAANKQSGPLWDEAILRATKERAPGQISSFFLGAGFKGRTNSDIQIDKFYGDWHRLWEMEPNYSPQEMQRAMSDMRKAYPFMDTLMLSKKGGLDRDRAYTYNVLSRIPPSMSDDIAKAADLNPELLRRFYDDKGHTETWPEQDRDRFMAGIVDIAAVLDMPDNATRDAWLNSKTAYQAMLELGEDNFGDNIWELEDTYYALMGDDPDDRQQAYDMMDANPVLEQAMKWKDQTIMFSPTLSAYYTSLDKIEAYYRGEMYTAIEKELGPDIWDKWDEYNEAKYRSDEDARAYWKTHPELERYMDIKEDWEDLIATNVINVGNLIKPGPGPQVRDIMGEMGIGSKGVQDFAEQLPTQMQIPPEVLQMALGNEAYNLLIDGKPYPPVLERKLEQMGITEDILEMILGGTQ